MFGLPLGMLSVADGGATRPTNTPEDMAALQKLYASVAARNRTPNGRVARGFDQFGPQPTPQAPTHANVPALGGLGLFPAAAPMAASPLQTAIDTPAPLPPPALSAEASSPLDTAKWPYGPVGAPSQAHAQATPMAPAQGPTSVGGAPLSGTVDQWNSVGLNANPASGPDVIQKLLNMFQQKSA